MTAPLSPSLIAIALVGRPHGVRGNVALRSHLENPQMLESFGWLRDANGGRWKVKWVGNGIARLISAEKGEITDREQAASLVNMELFAEESGFPAPDDGEYYHKDLVGLNAVGEQGNVLGRIERVHDYGAGASLELDCGLLVPFTRYWVPEVNLKARRVRIRVPREIEVRGDLDGEVEILQ